MTPQEMEKKKTMRDKLSNEKKETEKQGKSNFQKIRFMLQSF